MKKSIVIVCAAVAFAFTASTHLSVAQESKAHVYTAADLQKQIDQLTPEAKEKGGSGSTLGDFGSHALKLSLRSSSGGAEVHAHFDDVILVTHGSATLTTGGTVVDAKTGNDGETKGSAIENGVTQTISVGDLVHIPAGTPHQMKIEKGVLFTALVIKVKE